MKVLASFHEQDTETLKVEFRSLFNRYSGDILKEMKKILCFLAMKAPQALL